MPTNPYKQEFASGGWICAQCGQWVPDGTLHNCLKNQSAQYTGTYSALSSVEAMLQQILERLRVIQEDIEALKKEKNNE